MYEVYKINIDMVSLEVKINVTALSVSIHIAEEQPTYSNR